MGIRAWLLVVSVIVFLPRFVRAAEPMAVAEAPGLALPNAHRMASDVLKRMVTKLPRATQDRMRGIYVAFDTAAIDPYDLASCDDDGDYVIVMSDSLLQLADFVAQSGDKLDTYAAFAAREQRHGAKVVPPPPGMFSADVETDDSSFRSIVAFLIAHELAHVSLGHLVCAAPTTTHERNDDVWSNYERETALRLASTMYVPSRVALADRSAAWILKEVDEDPKREGTTAWLSFAARVEGRGASLVTYLRHHPGSAARQASFRVN